MTTQRCNLAKLALDRRTHPREPNKRTSLQQALPQPPQTHQPFLLIKTIHFTAMLRLLDQIATYVGDVLLATEREEHRAGYGRPVVLGCVVACGGERCVGQGAVACRNVQVKDVFREDNEGVW